MRLARGLGRRILLTAFVSSIIGFIASQLTIVHSIRAVSLERLERFGFYVFETWETRRCEANPESWSIELADETHVYAYDDRSLTSRNPKAPPLDRAIYESVVASGKPAVVVPLGPIRGGLTMFRAPRTGPCSVVVAYWPVTKETNQNVVFVPLAATVVVGWLGIGLAIMLVVRPLARRVEGLRAAAEHVGDEEGYTSAKEATDDDVGAVSASLDRAHRRIRGDAARLRRHLDDVAHDLRTPLASLQLALEQAADGAQDDEQSKLLVGALRDVVYIAGLTDDLRLASQLRDGWDPHAANVHVHIGETVERVVERARSLARRRGIELEAAVPDEPMMVRCDPIAGEQAIANVVQNAIAYGDPGGHVAVVLERTEAGFLLVIVDDGPGVAPNELPRLGERTFRSDEARQRDPRGSGLGLAITSEICTRCHWDLRFTNEAPRGLRVEIAGPLSFPERTHALRPEKKAASDCR